MQGQRPSFARRMLVCTCGWGKISHADTAHGTGRETLYSPRLSMAYALKKQIMQLKMESKTVNEIFYDWLEIKRHTVKESTLATYVIIAERHILPRFGLSTDVSEAEAQSFVVTLCRCGLSPRTVRDVMLVMRMIVSYGYRMGWMHSHDWHISRPKELPRRCPDVLTLTQQRMFMSFLADNLSPRNLGLYICLCTGLRIGEICGLRWADIDLSLRMLRVSRTVERIYAVDKRHCGTKIVINTPKTPRSLREIPINTALAGVLRKAMHPRNRDFYVLTNTSKPLEPSVYRRYYKSLTASLGMPRMKFHGLRHTFATRCIESQCDYKTVSVLLGHASVSTTLNLYVHPDMGQKRKCVDKMLRDVLGTAGNARP